MKNSQKKWLKALLFALAAIYALLIVFVPYFTLPATASAGVTSVYDHFVSMKGHVTGDVLFLILVVGILAGLYYFLIYRPKKVGKGKKAREISMARKVVWFAAIAYAVLLIAVPYVTLGATAAAWLVTVQDHFISVKDAIASDFTFLLFAGLLIGSGYYFLVHKPK